MQMHFEHLLVNKKNNKQLKFLMLIAITIALASRQIAAGDVTDNTESAGDLSDLTIMQ